MDTIETFLDNMFAPYPTTPRLTEARAELRAMMEDAYNDAIAQGKTHNEAVGQVITDFGNLHELAPVLGIAQDIQPGGAPQVAPAGAPTTFAPNRPTTPAPVGQPSSWQGEQDDDPFTNLVASIYWPLILVIFLAWGFLGNGWHICWIVWPIGGILFGAVASFINALSAGRRTQR